MAMQRYYYCLDGQTVQGPVDQPTLVSLIQQETVPPTGMILKDGETNWVSVTEYLQGESASSPEVVAAPANPFPSAEQSSSAQSVKFQAATCPSCGGPLQVPTNMRRVKCMYCGSDVAVQQTTTGSAEPGVEHYLRLARVARQQGKAEETEKNYLLALDHDPSCAEALLAREDIAKSAQASYEQSKKRYFSEMLELHSRLHVIRDLSEQVNKFVDMQSQAAHFKSEIGLTISHDILYKTTSSFLRSLFGLIKEFYEGLLANPHGIGIYVSDQEQCSKAIEGLARLHFVDQDLVKEFANDHVNLAYRFVEQLADAVKEKQIHYVQTIWSGYCDITGSFAYHKEDGSLFKYTGTDKSYLDCDEDALKFLTYTFTNQVFQYSKINTELLSNFGPHYENSEISASIVYVCDLATTVLTFFNKKVALTLLNKEEAEKEAKTRSSAVTYFNKIKLTHNQIASAGDTSSLVPFPNFSEKGQQIYQKLDELKDYWRMLEDRVYRAKINKKNRRLYLKSERASELSLYFSDQQNRAKFFFFLFLTIPSVAFIALLVAFAPPSGPPIILILLAASIPVIALYALVLK